MKAPLKTVSRRRFEELPAGRVHTFGSANSVAQDRYRKQIHGHEQNRAESNSTRSALAGAALSKRPMSLLKAAGIGAEAGLTAEVGIRGTTSGTKDSFGDRPLNTKRIEKLSPFCHAPLRIPMEG